MSLKPEMTPAELGRFWADQVFGLPQHEIEATLDRKYTELILHLQEINPSISHESLLGLAGSAVGAAMGRLASLGEEAHAAPRH